MLACNVLVLGFKETEYAHLAGLYVPDATAPGGFRPVEVKISVQRTSHGTSHPTRVGFDVSATREEVPITRHAADGRCLTGPHKPDEHGQGA